MCQLMGMQANNPTGFRERGGRTDKHVDGWGVAFFEGRGCRCFIDLTPSAHSPIASLICTYPIKTQTVIAHVRLATQGRAHLQNVHPFTRELWGRYWVFAHNGDVPHGAWVGRKGSCGAALYTKGERYTPVGDTDSEAAFCYFLNHLLKAYPDGPPSMADVYTTLRELWEGLCEQEGAIFNFLMGHNGDTLFAGCWSGARPGSSVWNSLYYTVREFPFSRCRLVDDDYEVDFTTVTNAKDRVAVIATAPLTTNEVWTEMAKGDMYAFTGGQPYTNVDDYRCALGRQKSGPDGNVSPTMMGIGDPGRPELAHLEMLAL